jgi:hypothetical protein
MVKMKKKKKEERKERTKTKKEKAGNFWHLSYGWASEKKKQIWRQCLVCYM